MDLTKHMLNFVNEQENEPEEKPKEEIIKAPVGSRVTVTTKPEELKGEALEALKAEKEYVGNKGDDHYYMVKQLSENGETVDLIMVDQEDKELVKASTYEIPPDQVANFLVRAATELGIERVSYDLLMGYDLLKQQEEPSEPNVETEPAQGELPGDEPEGGAGSSGDTGAEDEIPAEEGEEVGGEEEEGDTEGEQVAKDELAKKKKRPELPVESPENTAERRVNESPDYNKLRRGLQGFMNAMTKKHGRGWPTMLSDKELEEFGLQMQRAMAPHNESEEVAQEVTNEAEDVLKYLARGITDQDLAKRIADNQGGLVVTDPQDKDKFAVAKQDKV